MQLYTCTPPHFRGKHCTSYSTMLIWQNKETLVLYTIDLSLSLYWPKNWLLFHNVPFHSSLKMCSPSTFLHFGTNTCQCFGPGWTLGLDYRFTEALKPPSILITITVVSPTKSLTHTKTCVFASTWNWPPSRFFKKRAIDCVLGKT